VLLSGGAVPTDVAVPPAVRVVPLPALGHDDGYELVSRDSHWSLAEAQQARTARILGELRDVRPHVVIVELYPFGRRKFAFELLPLLEASRALAPRPVLLSSVRDILVTSRRDQARHDEQASVVANRWFDGVLVHADPRFARLEESFAARPSGRWVCVSAGGGLVGGPLLRAAVDAVPLVLDGLGLSTTIITGPFLPAVERIELEQAVAAHPGCTVVGFVADLAAEMAASAVSVSQCGYNTAMDVLSAGRPAVVVPYAAGREDEQLTRARRLEALGAVTVLEAGSLSASTLTDAIRRARLTGSDHRIELRLDGARRTVELVESMLAVGSDIAR
jgi:predicted glycosyltransferase